ncbi:MAG: hypothetical protein ACHREM_06200 [Polyangiales bacterium]
MQVVVPQCFASVALEHAPSVQHDELVPHDVAVHAVLGVVHTPLTQVWPVAQAVQLAPQ